MESNCDAKKTETKTFKFTIPQSIFTSDSEENRIKIPLVEKPLAAGPSSSLSARMFKVQYVLQFSLKHKVTGAS